MVLRSSYQLRIDVHVENEREGIEGGEERTEVDTWMLGLGLCIQGGDLLYWSYCIGLTTQQYQSMVSLSLRVIQLKRHSYSANPVQL